MEEVAGLQDWEFLSSGDGEPGPDSEDAPQGSESGSGGVVKPDYFVVETEIWGPLRPSSSNGETLENSLPDAGNPNWVESSSDPAFMYEPPSQGVDIQRQDPGELGASNGSSVGQETPVLQSLFEGPADGTLNPESAPVLEEGEGEGGRIHSEETGEEPCDSPKATVAAPPPPTMERASGMSCVERLPVVREEKAGFVWWKLPMEFLKLLAFKIRPTWSISMVAALMGAFMLGRRLYRKKPKSRRIPLKVSVGDKVSPFTVPVARLNEAFSVVKRVPVIRASLPAAGVAPWPALALR